MSLSVNSISGGNSYAYPAVTDSKESSNDTKKSKKSKQVISEKVGKYYCTYVVDESNNKHLISKIPIDKMEKQKLSKNLTGMMQHNIAYPLYQVKFICLSTIR
ncbi:hypothetical protein ACI7YV_13065 [Clostridium ljungdahlii]|uniref:hypothetical protein n=1 Tax=Clostridium ljungdahlii TaxID=1538 RepID=UPI00386F8036